MIKAKSIRKSSISGAVSLGAVSDPSALMSPDNGSMSDPKMVSRHYFVNGASGHTFANGVCAIGLFSGAGGLDVGTQLAGVRMAACVDNDFDSIQTLRSNSFLQDAQHFQEDVRNLTGGDFKSVLSKANPEKLIMVGGPPCQPFSKAGYWVTHQNRLGGDDPRNMIGQYLRLINEIRPDGFLLENVESLLHPKNIHVVETLEESIDLLGYKVQRFKANAVDFGVPQKRKRVFFLATKNGMSDNLLATHGSAEAISINPELKPYERVADWIAEFDREEYFEPQEVTLGKRYSDELYLIPPGKNYLYLTSTHGAVSPRFKANSRFWSFLLKLHPDEPSWTIAAQPGPWVGPFHWSGRRLRVPEIAAIQTFPRDYVFFGSRRSVQRQIGNAVPCYLAKAMIQHLLAHI